MERNQTTSRSDLFVCVCVVFIFIGSFARTSSTKKIKESNRKGWDFTIYIYFKKWNFRYRWTSWRRL